MLFEALPTHSLSREEASVLTNAQVLERLPASQRARGAAVLARFCLAFNKSFPLVEHLYECQRNIFLSPDGKSVDLGGGQSMCEQYVPVDHKRTKESRKKEEEEEGRRTKKEEQKEE